jgi:hydroxypyruvate isomerase
MSRFAANVGFLFAELPFLERFVAAHAAGFEAVEFAWPPEPISVVADAVHAAGLRVALLNMPAGDLAAGDRGWPNDPGRVGEWRQAFDQALAAAELLGCDRINVLAGNRLPDMAWERQQATLHDNLRWALERSASAATLLLEVLNPIDTPDYLLVDPAAAVELIDAIGSNRLRLQFDTYHFGTLGFDVAAAFARFAPLIGHVQVADVPGRASPGTGALDFPAFFAAVAHAGYGGAIGLEYVTDGDTQAALGWLPRPARRWSAERFRLG